MTETEPAKAEFDAYSGNYDKAVNAAIGLPGLNVDYFTKVKAEYLIDMITAHFGDAAKADILDIGCGIGNYHKLICDRVGSVSGVDVSPDSITEARKRNPSIQYQVYEGKRLPFTDASFDVAFTICVMHHVPPPQWPQFTAEMKRVLKPGGMAIVFEHNPRNPLTRRVVSNCVFDKTAVLLNSEQTRALLEGAGFRDILSRSIISIPPSGSLLRRMDLQLGRLALGAQYFVRATA